MPRHWRDTSEKPPGGDVGGSDLPRRRPEAGAGASPVDMRRQYKKPKQPTRGDRSPRDGWIEYEMAEKGFISRSPFSDERN